MKWGRNRNYKRRRRIQFIFRIRQEMANACGIPIEYMVGSRIKTSNYFHSKIKHINRIFVDGCNAITKHLPRKRKKKLRKMYQFLKLK